MYQPKISSPMKVRKSRVHRTRSVCNPINKVHDAQLTSPVTFHRLLHTSISHVTLEGPFPAASFNQYLTRLKVSISKCISIEIQSIHKHK
ncbi:hypothetical protein JTE90_029059 [Oedothorax gibbosus]|uniref:Uncharacterized protein n=1 Tax=Oedothorax gibbosus TaxID=931172 RepID=A0AAV6UXR4_9ARAC|nr:hypothetical protein JTE90_029059 [Oedothorax gibbosus]